VTNDGQDINGLTVLFSVTGANTASGSDVSGPHGKADFTYPGRNAGDDTITACLDLNGNGVCNTPTEPTASIGYTWEPQCNNGQDDDHDGLVDHPADPGCFSLGDPIEQDPRVCADGIDNDRDRAIDFPNDPGCSSRDDPTEIFDNPEIGPGGGGGGGGTADGTASVSPAGGVPVVVPAHSVGHARFRVVYGKIVRAHHKRHLVVRIKSRRTQRVRVRIKLRYSHNRVRRVTRTVWTNTRVTVRGLRLDGVHGVRLTVLG
jgi:hypothetical protein